MSGRHLENVLTRTVQLDDTSWKGLEDVLKTSWKYLKDVLKTFLEDDWRRFEDVLKTSFQDVLKTSWKRPLKTKAKDLFIKTSVCLDASVETGSIFPSMISGISFSTPSKSTSSMTCHSSSGNAIAQTNSFLWQASILPQLDVFQRLFALFIAAFSGLFQPAVWSVVLLGLDAPKRKTRVYAYSYWHFLVKGYLSIRYFEKRISM